MAIPVPWDELDDPVGLMETVLGRDRATLFSGRPESPLYIRGRSGLDRWRRLPQGRPPLPIGRRAARPPGKLLGAVEVAAAHDRPRLLGALELLFGAERADQNRPGCPPARAQAAPRGRPRSDAFRWGDSGTFEGDGMEAADPVQGCLGDCYLIGAMVAIAHADPTLLRLKPLSTGGARVEAVFTALDDPRRAAIAVRDDVPLVGNTRTPLYGRSVKAGESWPAVLEKAYASWRTGGGNRPPYAAISGGDCLEALRELTGLPGGERRLARGAVGWLQGLCEDESARSPIMGWTYPAGGYSGVNVLAGHAYAILGVASGPRGQRYVIVRNPFGRRDETDPYVIPRSALATRWQRAFRADRGLIALAATAFEEFFHGVAALPLDRGRCN